MKIIEIDINKLNPSPYNPRIDLQEDDKEYIKLKKSIEKFGYVEPLIINTDFTIIGGHQRFKILKQLNFKKVNCVVVELKNKNDEKALNIALNKISGDWDIDKLKEIMKDLQTEDFEIELTGFDNFEIENFIKDIDLKETPKRVAKYYMETLEGMTFTNQDIAKMFNKCFDDELENIEKYRDMVIVKDIPCFSFCEHHLALIYNMNITIAYIPKNKVIGLSKLARIADMICKRLQLQEKIGNDIAEIVELITETNNIAIIISAEHSCMTTRGIRKNGTKTITSTLRGDFLKKSDLRNELMILIK